MKNIKNCAAVKIIGLGKDADAVLASSFLMGVLKFRDIKVSLANYNYKYLFDLKDYSLNSNFSYIFFNAPSKTLKEENAIVYLPDSYPSYPSCPNYRTATYRYDCNCSMSRSILEDLYACDLIQEIDPKWFLDRVEVFQEIVFNADNLKAVYKYIEQKGFWKISDSIVKYFSRKSADLILEKALKQDPFVEGKNQILEAVLRQAETIMCEEMQGSLIISSGLDSEIFDAIKDVWDDKSNFDVDVVKESQFVVLVNPFNGKMTSLIRGHFVNDGKLMKFLNSSKSLTSYRDIIMENLNSWRD